MEYKEYKHLLQNMTKEQLIIECLKLKEDYDKSCRSWLYTESLRNVLMDLFVELESNIESSFKDLMAKNATIKEQYNRVVADKKQYYDNLDNEYQKDKEN